MKYDYSVAASVVIASANEVRFSAQFVCLTVRG